MPPHRTLDPAKCLDARAIPCSMAFSKLFSDVELISTIRAMDITRSLPCRISNRGRSLDAYKSDPAAPLRDAQSLPARCFPIVAGRRENPRASHREWVCLRCLACLPSTGAFEWNQRHCPIDNGLQRQTGQASGCGGNGYGFRFLADRSRRSPARGALIQNCVTSLSCKGSRKAEMLVWA